MLAELGYLDSPASEACYLARYYDWAEQSSVLYVLMKERVGRRYALEDPKPVLLLATAIVRADKRSGGRSAAVLSPCNSHRSTSENSPGYIEDAFVSYFRRIYWSSSTLACSAIRDEAPQVYADGSSKIQLDILGR